MARGRLRRDEVSAFDGGSSPNARLDPVRDFTPPLSGQRVSGYVGLGSTLASRVAT
jgi:hypothetical protein